jgi:hypothetical protein
MVLLSTRMYHLNELTKFVFFILCLGFALEWLYVRTGLGFPIIKGRIKEMVAGTVKLL